MILFDKILLAVIALGAVMGLFRGFLREAVSTFGLLLAAIIANLAIPYGLGYVGHWFSSQHTASIVLWVFFFVLVMLLLTGLAKMLGEVLSSASLGWTNRLAGGAFGAIKVALLSALLISAAQVFSSMVPALSIQEYVAKSQIVPVLHQVVGLVMPWVTEHILNPALEMLR